MSYTLNERIALCKQEYCFLLLLLSPTTSFSILRELKYIKEDAAITDIFGVTLFHFWLGMHFSN